MGSRIISKQQFFIYFLKHYGLYEKFMTAFQTNKGKKAYMQNTPIYELVADIRYRNLNLYYGWFYNLDKEWRKTVINTLMTSNILKDFLSKDFLMHARIKLICFFNDFDMKDVFSYFTEYEICRLIIGYKFIHLKYDSISYFKKVKAKWIDYINKINTFEINDMETTIHTLSETK